MSRRLTQALHGHGDLSAGAGLSQVEEGVDQAAEVEIIAGEVVLADSDITVQDLAVVAVRPAGQAHMGGWSALARDWMSSAAVWPWTA